MDAQETKMHGFDYVFDEETSGFGEPSQAPASESGHGGQTLLQRLAVGLVAVGFVAAIVQIATGKWLGTMPGFLMGVALPAVAGAGYFIESYRHGPAGIKNNGVFFGSLTARGLAGWIAGIAMTALYVMLYFYPSYLGYVPAIWGANGLEQEALVTGGLVKLVEPLATALGVTTSQWFLYGVLYTGSILVFGVRTAMRYRHNRYQLVRTGSVMFFQTIFAWYLPQLLVRFNQPYVEFNGVWPLKNNYLWPEKASAGGELLTGGSLGPYLLGFAVLGVIATPILTYFYGKRWYCSWVCGCGGLAETLGDPWRHLSDKSTRAWKIEKVTIYSVLGLVLLTTGMLWVDYLMTGNKYGSWSGEMRNWYGFYIGAVFSGVVGVGFYPLLGSRVWCRFGCPQAAILGILQRVMSRFRITTNGGQCISCGNCSTYCEMGIDVRSYAQKGENIVRASCVGCGICAAVCPRGVLKLENGSSVLGEERMSS